MDRPPNNVLIGFSIHLFTASGAFWAFLALVAAAEGRFTNMWFWLGVALLVDGVDGPLARYFNVKTVLPNWSGELLDCIIDYVTFAMIPAFALYQSGFLDEIYSFICAALIVCTSAIYYADTRMKSRDNCFIGFPICWNMLVFTLFVMEPGWYIAFGVVIVSTALTFSPLIMATTYAFHACSVDFVWIAGAVFLVFWHGSAVPCQSWHRSNRALSLLHWLRSTVFGQSRLIDVRILK
jgi:phosphatidylcholine synthase